MSPWPRANEVLKLTITDASVASCRRLSGCHVVPVASTFNRVDCDYIITQRHLQSLPFKCACVIEPATRNFTTVTDNAVPAMFRSFLSANMLVGPRVTTGFRHYCLSCPLYQLSWPYCDVVSNFRCHFIGLRNAFFSSLSVIIRTPLVSSLSNPSLLHQLRFFLVIPLIIVRPQSEPASS